MAKEFTRIEPTTIQVVGNEYKRQAVIKTFQTEDGLRHEFTTIHAEDARSAAVIALTPDNQVISVFQFRPGSEQWVYEIPGGGLYADEDPEVGAIRELKEETGYAPGLIKYIGDGRFDAYSNIKCHYYLATNCILDSGGVDRDEEEDEQGAEVRLISIAELIKSARDGAMGDPRAVLQAYEKLRELEGQ